ncbi:unnamed protein product, partial [Dracunculus medinensis]|uniref:Fibronectin type-III domain-containing protein n=1 Tax=Dracunculus medinensis TaxID=318479 RepID=A0A0N4U194_DRAME
SLSATVEPNVTSYQFDNLIGNTTYRISVEGFSNDRSVLYTSAMISTSLAVLKWLPAPSDITLIDKSWDFMEIRWTAPIVASARTQAMINQHLRYKLSIQLPTTKVTFLNLDPRTVYNVTIQASTEFGYGDLGWATYSTLDVNEDFILRLKTRTPNSLTIKWPASWFDTPSTRYTGTRILHSIVGSEKEISISSYNDGHVPEHLLHDLEPGATFNVTLIYIMEVYIANVLDPQPESALQCPKVGCDWLCLLIFNLAENPREYTFDIRAQVAGVWNKWVPIARRYMSFPSVNSLCSINPPLSFVANIGKSDFMREIVIEKDSMNDPNVWKYLVVIDRRVEGDIIGAVDISRLSDKVTSDHENIPYYITAALIPEYFNYKIPFRIGDGQVYGGYLNYPLDKGLNPRWFLIPLSQTESEIMEPTLKYCGFREDGTIECELSVAQLLSFVPWWLGLLVSLIIIFVMLLVLLIIFKFFQRQFCKFIVSFFVK